MNSKNGISQRLLEKIETDLGPDDFATYKAVFMSFICGEIDYPTYQQKIMEVLGIRLLPFHQRFVNLFRKRVIESKSTQRFKSILLRIQDDKPDPQAESEKLAKELGFNSMAVTSKTPVSLTQEAKHNYQVPCIKCRKIECICKLNETKLDQSRASKEQIESKLIFNPGIDQGLSQQDKTGKYF